MSVDAVSLTMFHLGDSVGLRDDVVKAAERAARQVRAAPFAVAFDQVATFASQRQRLLGSSANCRCTNTSIRRVRARSGTSV